ncbi:nitroreductase family protein [Candidatus Bathyarchaeota archaeon]|nr:MAG: nitroreductase family protein [Candidatus Bathyarchaeota archaeon]
MDIFKAIKTRRSIRVFTKEEVSEEEIEEIIDAARWAPSAGNIQPWIFIVVRDPKRKERLSKAALNQLFIEKAPVIIVVCADQERSKKVYGRRGVNLYCIQDTAAAIQNLLLAAHALRLGACWVGAFDEEAVRRALNIPSGVRPVAIIPIGRPAVKPGAVFKRSLNEIVHYESF